MSATGPAPLPPRPGLVDERTPPEEADPEDLGGKGAALWATARQGFPVPAFFCVPTGVFQRAVAAVGEELDALMGTLRELQPGQPDAEAVVASVGERARALVAGAGVPERDAAAILERFDERFAADAKVAVRSSVRGEDSAGDSFAGQMDTYLFVGRDALLERIAACFASAFTDRALAYRRLRGQLDEPVAAAVVVQEMVDGAVSGVLFTANPVTGDLAEVVVSAGLGLGEGVVGGLVETDTFYLAKADGSLRRADVVLKRSAVVFDTERGRGTRTVEVDGPRGSEPALDEARLSALADLGRRLEDWAGTAQDVEWTLDREGGLRLLQTRPITTLRAPARRTLFDNSNVVESYPGISLPLTFSFVRLAYAATFGAALRMLGLSRRTVADNRTMLENLVSLVDGRVYYNILNWYRLFSLLGLERALPAWERALGIDAALYRPPRKSRRERLQRAWVDASVRLSMVRHLFVLHRRVRAYLDRLDRMRNEMARTDLGALDAHTLLDVLEGLEQELLAPYGISVVNDLFTQQFYALLGKLVGRWGLGEVDTVANALLAGETEMDSVAPVRSMLGLAQRIREDADLLALFESGADPVAIWEAVHSEARFGAFRGALAMHLADFGDRTLHELKLETLGLADDPGFVVTMLRNYLRGGQSADALESGERRRREEAEAEAWQKLGRFGPRARVFAYVLGQSRATVRNRENLRLARTRAFGFVRSVYAALGRLFADQGLLDDPRDVFWLDADEVKGCVRGHLLTRDLRALVALRKQDYEQFRVADPAARVEVRGVVYAAPFAAADRGEVAAGDLLVGQGCSAGRARAPAKVVLRPDSDLRIDGQILVAPMTDPGWVFLMVSAGGLVVEKGSLLSHTAIIGRELGVPTVVGVTDATRAIRDGDLLEIDGRAGTVTIVERRGEA